MSDPSTINAKYAGQVLALPEEDAKPFRCPYCKRFMAKGKLAKGSTVSFKCSRCKEISTFSVM